MGKKITAKSALAALGEASARNHGTYSTTGWLKVHGLGHSKTAGYALTTSIGNLGSLTVSVLGSGAVYVGAEECESLGEGQAYMVGMTREHSDYLS